MLNYPANSSLITAARVALFFALLFSYPILLHPTRAALNNFILYVVELYRNHRSSADAAEDYLINQPASLQVWKKKERKMSLRVQKVGVTVASFPGFDTQTYTIGIGTGPDPVVCGDPSPVWQQFTDSILHRERELVHAMYFT